MTKEEAIKRLKETRTTIQPYQYVDEAIDMAIKALEQEPSGDLISRKAVLNTLDNMDNALNEDRTLENYKELLKECYEVLLPVNPQEPKTGHWKEIGYHIYECSECGRVESINDFENVYIEYPYCHCGARMESEE
jgi:hypothetical protein